MGTLSHTCFGGVEVNGRLAGLLSKARIVRKATRRTSGVIIRRRSLTTVKIGDDLEARVSCFREMRYKNDSCFGGCMCPPSHGRHQQQDRRHPKRHAVQRPHGRHGGGCHPERHPVALDLAPIWRRKEMVLEVGRLAMADWPMTVGSKTACSIPYLLCCYCGSFVYSPWHFRDPLKSSILLFSYFLVS